MKKALQNRRLRAKLSLPDETAGGGSREARGSGSRDRFSKLRILDLLGERRSLEPVLLGRLEPPIGRRRRTVESRLRNRTWNETDPFDAQSRRDLLAPVLQLERPDRVHRVDIERRVAALGDQFGLGQEKREHGETLLALRAERAQVPLPGDDPDLVQMRPGSGPAAFEVATVAFLERRDCRRLGFVHERASGKSQLA